MSRVYLAGVLALLVTACGGPSYPETWEPTAHWLPYGGKGQQATPVLIQPDHDEDGIENDRDRCPDLPEDVDGFRDEDGCPDPDHDGDGVPDGKDE